jgi:fructokinase
MIVCGGENLMDVIEEPGADGMRRFRAVAGGSPYNCARALGRLGARTGYLTPISADVFGEDLAAVLAADGVAHLGPRPEAPTSLAMVTLRDGQPDYRFYREGTAERLVTADSLAAAMPDGARALHLGSLAISAGADARAWAGLFAQAASAGRFTSLDPNIRPLLAGVEEAAYRDRLAAMTTQAALIKLSDEDLAWWMPGLTPEEGADVLAVRAPGALVLVTQGAGPVLCRGPFGGFAQEAAAVAQLADTVGAGDTLMAAMLAGLDRIGALERGALAALSEAVLRPVLADACRAAAITCGRIGCDPPRAADLWG